MVQSLLGGLRSGWSWHRKELKRVREEKGCGVDVMVWDAAGCVLTVRCCSSGLVYSSYGLKGGRRDVGVTVMETKSAHADHEIQGYITGTACNRIRTWNSTESNKNIKWSRQIKPLRLHTAAQTTTHWLVYSNCLWIIWIWFHKPEACRNCTNPHTCLSCSSVLQRIFLPVQMIRKS